MTKRSLTYQNLVFALFLHFICLIPCFAATIYIEDFGAVADGKTDCTEAFEKAIAKANDIGPGVTIKLSKGRYILSTEVPDRELQPAEFSDLEGKEKEESELHKGCRLLGVKPCITMTNVRGVTFEGQGLDTEIIFNCPLATGFELTQCGDVVFRDMVMDYDPIPFTQGTIVAVNAEAGTFDYKIDNGFPQLNEYWFNKCDSKWGIPLDGERLFRMNGEHAVFSDSWDDLGNATWRMHLHYKEHGQYLNVGDRFAHLARMGGVSTIFFSQCGDVAVEDVYMYSNGCSGVIGFQCRGEIHVNRLNVLPRPGSDRILSLNGDAVHFQSCRKGPLIENCIFESLADDAMNFYAMPSVIAEILAPNKVRVKELHVLQKNDHVQIIRALEGLIVKDDVEVTDVDGMTVTFAEDIEDLKAGKNHIVGDTIFNLSASGSGFVVRNNIIGGIRTRGVLASAQNGLVENNLIRDTGWEGIQIVNEPDWPQGPIPANVIIRNNTLVGTRRDRHQAHCGAIHVASRKMYQNSADQSSMKGALIENNLIVDSPGSAILLEGVSDAKVLNNKVQLRANERPINEYIGITLRNCRKIEIDGFTMVDQWGRVEAGILLDKTPQDEMIMKNISVDVSESGQLIKTKQGKQSKGIANVQE